jgi:hypothetical protein
MRQTYQQSKRHTAFFPLGNVAMRATEYWTEQPIGRLFLSGEDSRKPRSLERKRRCNRQENRQATNDAASFIEKKLRYNRPSSNQQSSVTSERELSSGKQSNLQICVISDEKETKQPPREQPGKWLHRSREGYKQRNSNRQPSLLPLLPWPTSNRLRRHIRIDVR